MKTEYNPFDQGRADYFAGRQLSANPYTDRHLISWRAGWTDAQVETIGAARINAALETGADGL